MYAISTITRAVLTGPIPHADHIKWIEISPTSVIVRIPQ
jgi:hypothetical protein